MAKIICIVPSSTTFLETANVLNIFTNFGFLNVAIVHKASSGSVGYQTFEFKRPPKGHSEIFPDKLKDLGGYRYRIPLYHQPPIIKIRPEFVKPVMAYFLDALGTVQNSRYKIYFLSSISHLEAFWENRGMDLTFNTGSVYNVPYPKLFTYEKYGFCALIPIPPKISIFQTAIIEPFSDLIWILFGVSMVCSVAVWRMYQGRGAVDSHWKLAAGIFMMFIGQGADFSRRNRFVLAMLLNIICLSVFLLSNLYETIITSYMIEPAHENRLKTVDDLLRSDHEILTDKHFSYLVRDDERYQAIKSRISLLHIMNEDDIKQEIIRKHYIFVRLCDLAELDLTSSSKNGRLMSDYYYMLPEKLTWKYVQLEASYMNPFLTRFQYYMDLSFQAGLPHMWKLMANQSDDKKYNPQETTDNDQIRLNDLWLLFKILLIGLTVSFLCLLIEISYHDCIRHLNIRKIIHQIRNYCSTKRHNISKPNVRKVLVRPMRDQ